MKKSKTAEVISGLEWAIAQTIEKPRDADEFTCEEFRAGCGVMTVAAAYSKLKRMCQDGSLTSRRVTMGGKTINLYKRA